MRYDMMAINLLFTAISALLVIVYLRNNGIVTPTKRTVIFIISFSLVNSLLSAKMTGSSDLFSTIKPIILMIISISIIKYILLTRWSTSAIAFLFFMVGMGIGNAINVLIMGMTIGGDVITVITTNAVVYFISNIVTMTVALLFMIAIRPMYSLLKILTSNKEFLYALIFTFLIFAATTGLYYYIKVFNLTAYLLITFMSLLCCGYILINSTALHKREREKTEREQQEFYNKSLENTLINLRRFKHDWNNSMAAINAMLATEQTTEAREFLNEIIEYNATNNDTSIFNIKNAGLFGIISAKQGLARDKGLEVLIKGFGEVKNIPGIKITELCEVVGIVLDNAIEESEKVNGNIEFNYSDDEKTIELSVKNKCEKDIDLRHMESSKGEGRGNGLKIVNQIVNKHKNVQNLKSYDPESKTFEQLLIIEKGL